MAARRPPKKRLVREDSLSSAARAAGFVMATPDDEPSTPDSNSMTKPAPAPLALESAGWKSAPPRRAVEAAPTRPASLHHAILLWFATLTGRAPA